MTIRPFIAVATVTLLTSCASSSGVFQTGDGVFRVATRATWELGGRAGAVKMALEEATQHCKKTGKSVKVLNSDESYGHFEGGRVDIQFTCISPS